MPKLWSDALSVPPAIEPVSTEDARRNCDLDDDYRDSDLRLWIVEAREQVEHDARVALITQTRVLKFDCWSNWIKMAAVSPVASITSIAYTDTAGASQTLSTDVYGTDLSSAPAAVYIKCNQSWPELYDQPRSISITYVAGYGSTAETVPAAARSAILMLVRHRFDMPELVAAGGRNAVLVPLGYQAQIDKLRGGTYP